ncbi:MAG: hypothetical protein ACR2RB_12115 [Gammaproteobacteria bacterium]
MTKTIAIGLSVAGLLLSGCWPSAEQQRLATPNELLRKEHQRLTNDVQRLLAEKAELSRTLAAAGTELEQIPVLRQGCDAALDELAELQERYQKLQAELRTAKDTFNSTQTTAAQLKEALLDARDQLQTSAADITSLRQVVEAAEAELQTLREKD